MQPTEIAPKIDPAIMTRSASQNSTPAPTWVPPSWLSNWRHGDAVPARQGDIAAEIERGQQALFPASHKRIIDCVRRLSDLMNVPLGANPNPESLASWWLRNEPMYVAALEDLPEDLLTKACRECVKRSTYFPRPAEIRRQVEDEFTARSGAVMRLQTVLLAARTAGKSGPSGRLTDADRDWAIKRSAEIRAQLSASSETMRMP